MKYILIGCAIVAVIFACIQAVGLILVLAVMKKQEQRLNELERLEESSADIPVPQEENTRPVKEGETI